MKLLLTFFIVFSFNTSHAQLISEDDQLHFAIGAGIAASSYAVIYSKTKNSKKAFWYSLGLSTLAGLSKEIYDGYIISGKFDTGEAISTSAGGFVASYTFNLFTRKKKTKIETPEKEDHLEDLVLN
ncbi:hypothetical protein HNV08_07775 [Winogradskyella eckloniae]|uniref:hypothetical protein n=1 Tax=Winogradskyella eckloniae TaxID=1089306 RepID=UPI0015646351|nr:hypothetical protein [Winogradskyella eckloniae]NRD19942.1 hypothetical protein [Winogradskyella eckloniae]